MNLINRPDIVRRLTREFDLKERNPAPTIAPEVQPVVLLHDLTVDPGPDQGFIDEACNQVVAGGGGGQFAKCKLRNNTVDRILRITAISFTTLTTGNSISLRLEKAATPFANPSLKVVRLNTRVNPLIVFATDTQRVSSEATAGSPGNIFHSIATPFASGGSATIDVPIANRIVIGPGDALIVMNDTATAGLTVNLAWREEPATLLYGQ